MSSGAIEASDIGRPASPPPIKRVPTKRLMMLVGGPDRAKRQKQTDTAQVAYSQKSQLVVERGPATRLAADGVAPALANAPPPGLDMKELVHLAITTLASTVLHKTSGWHHPPTVVLPNFAGAEEMVSGVMGDTPFNFKAPSTVYSHEKATLPPAYDPRGWPTACILSSQRLDTWLQMHECKLEPAAIEGGAMVVACIFLDPDVDNEQRVRDAGQQIRAAMQRMNCDEIQESRTLTGRNTAFCVLEGQLGPLPPPG